jgi:hypothetical protein
VNDVLLFCSKKINETFSRDGYKKVIELVIIFLEKKPTQGTHFRPPGAYYLAR